MTKINLFIKILFLLIAIIFCAIPQCSSAISNKRLCYDPDCSAVISHAKTVLRYNPREPELLPFAINVDVKVYSKGAGNRTDLWGVEINGKRGYVPKTFLKEYKVLHKNLKYEVPTTQVHRDTDDSKNKKSQSKEETNKLSSEVLDHSHVDAPEESTKEVQDSLNEVTPAYKVIEGTTVHFEQNEASIQPNPVSKTIEPTAVPNSQKDVEFSQTVASKIEKSEGETLNVKPVNNNQEGHNILHNLNFRSFMPNSDEITKLPEIAGVTTSIPPIEATTDFEETDKEDIETSTPTGGINVLAEDKSNLINNTMTDGSQKVGINGHSDINTESLENVTNNGSTDVSMLNQTQEEGEESNNSVDEHNLEINSENTISESATINIHTATEQNLQKLVNEESSESSSSESIETSEENINVHQDTNDHSLEKHIIDNNSTAVSSDETDKQDEHIPKSTSVDNKVEVKEEIETTNTEGKEEIILKTATILNEGTASANEKHIMKEGANEDIADESVIDTVITNATEKHESVSIEDNSNNSNKKMNNLLQDEHHQNIVEEKEASLAASLFNVEASPNIEAEEVNKTVVVTVSSVSQESSNTISDDKIATIVKKEDTVEDLQLHTAAELQLDQQNPIEEKQESDVNHTRVNDAVLESTDVIQNTTSHGTDVNIDVNTNEELNYESNIAEDVTTASQNSNIDTENINLPSSEQLLYSSQESLVQQDISNFNEFRNRNLLNVESSNHNKIDNTVKDDTGQLGGETLPEYGTDISDKAKDLSDNLSEDSDVEKSIPNSLLHEVKVMSTPDVCTAEYECKDSDNIQNHLFIQNGIDDQAEKSIVMSGINIEHNYWLTLLYLSVTAITMLVFSLGYYYIENMRRDGQLIAKINKLEKELLVSTKECTMLTDNLKATKEKLTCIEDESFGSNEMVLSLKADLESSQAAKVELEDQIAMLEKDLETTTEAGLELERMLREVLFSNNEVNPLAQSVEDLQARLNAQQATNESLTNALNLKTQENETLSAELASVKTKYEQLEVELTQLTANLKSEIDSKRNMEQILSDKVHRVEMQLKEISTEKTALQKELKGKEVEMKDLVDVINQLNSNNFDFEKLYEVSHIKAEATMLLEERNELKVRLSEVEGAHNLLEEHVKLVKEEVATLSEQCKAAEREKKDAETRLEVLAKFFKEKEAERQKEEAIWLQKQGEVMSTVERIQTMQNEIQNYKQQLEMLKREIIDQEREYKGQISALETKAHEQWVLARQMERRLEESKADAGQLRNLLTFVEKNLNEVDPDTKLHRLEANGETATSPPLFIGAESSSSPIMFSGPSGVPPPPPPSYMHSIFPPYLPPPLPTTSGVPPYEVGQRPPPLGGRLSSPPPMPLHQPSSRYDNAGSPPPPISPHLLPPFNHRSPLPPFGGEHIHPPAPPPGSMLPPPPGARHPWGEESLPPLRNSGFQPPQRKERVRNDKDFQPVQREQRVRNDKDSLRSSIESLDKTHHSI